jgi:hypothetical protein
MTGSAPPPRDGLLGRWDEFVGPGATAAETGGALALGAAGGVAAPLWLRRRAPEAGRVRLGLAALVGSDIGGGVWTNATVAAKRWYAPAGAGPGARVAFAAAHLHPYLVAASDPRRPVRWALALHAAAVAGTVATALVPRRLALPVAVAAALGGQAAAALAGDTPRGWEWFAPAYLAKLLVGHAAPLPED